MPSIWDVLKGIETGLSEADRNLGIYREGVEEDELRKLKQILQDQKEEEKRKKDAQKEEAIGKGVEAVTTNSNKSRLDKISDNVRAFLGNVLGIKTENYDEIVARDLAKIGLVEEYLKINNLPKNEKQRKLVGNYLESLSPEKLAEEFNVPIPLKDQSQVQDSTPPQKEKKYQKPESPEYAHLSDEDYEASQKFLNWFTGGSLSDAIKSIPSGLLETGEGISGLVGAKSLKEKLRALKGKYEEYAGIENRDALPAQLGRLAADMALPTKFGKIGKAIPKSLKPSVVGGLYGAIQAEKEDDNPLAGALLGAGTSAALQGVGKGISKVKQSKFNKIRKDATFDNPEDILKRAKVMGPKATIPEVVGSEPGINKTKRNGSILNRKRLENIEGNIKKEAKETISSLPKGEDELQSLYKNIGEMVDPNIEGSIAERSAKLYDTVRDQGIGKEGILDKNTLTKWIKAAKEVESDVKGLPKLKTNAGKISEVEKILMDAPQDPKSYRAFVIKHSNQIPTAGDFIKYRSSVNKMLRKADSTQHEGLSVLSKSLDNIIENADVNSVLKKASKDYATGLGPLKQKKIKEAVSATKFSESKEGRPSISKVFGEQSTENNLAFKQLSKEDKKRVLGAFLEENMKSEKNPIRSVTTTYEKLPSYIKESKDPTTRAIVKDMKNIADISKTYTSMQRSTTPDIGSRVPMGSMKNLMRLIGYGGTAFVNPTMTAGIALADMGVKGGTALAKAAKRKGVGQKYLKYYMKPELLEELYSKRMGRLSKPPTKLIIENTKKEEK